jgi:hypothetical protein
MSRILTSKGWRELNEKRDDVLESDSYAATMAAKAHAEKDGENYDGDVSVQHRYDAYHFKKRGYTHFTPQRMGVRKYHKNAVPFDAKKITSDHHQGVSE